MAMATHKLVDLTGAACSECKKKCGVAKVCFKHPKRYFWGCSRYPGCRGPRAWQWLDVPQPQRDECDAAYEASLAAAAAKETDGKKKRARTKAVPGDVGISMRVPVDPKIKSERTSRKRVRFGLGQRQSFLTFCRRKLNEDRGANCRRCHAIA